MEFKIPKPGRTRTSYYELLVGRKVIWRGKGPELDKAHRRLHDKYCSCRRGETCRIAFNHFPKTLADTGADFSLVPRPVGWKLLGRVRSARVLKLGGVAPRVTLCAYLHRVRMRLGPHAYRSWVAVAAVDHVPVLLGRFHALDRFDARFVRGRFIELR